MLIDQVALEVVVHVEKSTFNLNGRCFAAIHITPRLKTKGVTRRATIRMRLLSVESIGVDSFITYRRASSFMVESLCPASSDGSPLKFPPRFVLVFFEQSIVLSDPFLS